MQERRRRRARGLRIDHRFERLVVDAHQLGGVLGEVAALRHHQRDRLADIAHALDRQRPLIDRRLQRDQERVGQLAHVLAGDHRPHAVLRQRRGRVDADDLGVRVRRADDVSVQRPVRHRQVVRIAAMPREQSRIFLAKDRAPKPGDTQDLADLDAALENQHCTSERTQQANRDPCVTPLSGNPALRGDWSMNFVVPAPSETFDVALDDGANIRLRRHGNPDGVRLRSRTATALQPTPICRSGSI